ncbi:phage tail tape measure protein [Azotobacter beijerinckii]|uniref:Phage tail tape measure protein, lambda family n=1 Tax=Azotobacter beijerinckii TaxID=170623 RepID=A0A1I0YZR2_9GAMM|nr:phage tail tape measure protein [Azotobacter beijerinckii]SFB18929.1 phage tail tape measure protein, lambda family [Azotobacter beijerinckii]
MPSIASLSVEINTSDAARAGEDLDRMVDAGRRSEEAARRLNGSWKKSLSGIAGDTSQIVRELQALNAKQDATAQLMATVGQSVTQASAAFQSSVSAISAYRAQSEQLGRTESANTSAVNGTSSALNRQRDDLAKLLGQIDPTVAALGRLDEMEKRLQGFRNKGQLDAQTFAEYKTKIDQMRESVTATADSWDRAGISSKQMQAALRGLPAQFTDIVVSLQGGQAPLTVLLQQGGQIKDMFGGVGPAFSALGGYIMELVGPVTVAAAAVSTLGFAYYQGSREQSEFRESLALTGNSLGTTTGNLASMAKEVGGVIGTTGIAAEALTALASTGKVTGANLQAISTAAVTMQRATGKAVSETAAEFASLADDPARAVVTLNQKYNFLTAAVYEQIRALQAQGDRLGAQEVAERALADAQTQRGNDLIENLGYIRAAWHTVAEAAKGAWDAALNVGREDTLDAALTKLEERLRNVRNAATPAVFSENPDLGLLAGGEAGAQGAIEATLQREVDTVREAREKMFAAQNFKSSQSFYDSFLEGLRADAPKAERLKYELEKLAREVGLARQRGFTVSEEQYQQRVAQLREKYKESAAKSTPVNLTEVKDVQNDLKAIQAEYSNANKTLEANQRAGLISQQSYLDQRTSLIRQERDEVESAYQRQISALEEVRGRSTTNANQRVQLDQKIADARAAMVKAQKASDSELEVLSINEQGRLLKQSQAISTYTQALNQQVEALRNQGARAVAGVGMGDRQRGIYDQLNGLADQAAQQQIDLANQYGDGSRGMSLEEYTAKLQALKDTQNDLRATVISNYDAMAEAQSDWRAGAKAAYENYLEDARNVAGMTENLFTSAFSSMEDAVVEFAMTGKLSFADFTKSILADMARIAARQASSSILSGLGGVAASAIGGLFGGSTAGSSISDYASVDLSNFRPQAKGGAWIDGVQAFAKGGAFTNSVISSPTLFPFAKGTGLMGEAGPEAIMPLTRGADGSLGVRAMGGGGSTPIVINAPVTVQAQPGMSSQEAARQGAQMGQAMTAEIRKAIGVELRQGGQIWRALNGR